jgi:hypothetical protein
MPFYVNPAVERLTSYKSEQFSACPQLWLKLVVADDRQRVIEGLATLMREGTLEREYRIVHADGGQCCVRSTAQVVHGTGGTPSRIDGVIAEIMDFRQPAGLGAALPQRHHAATLHGRSPAAPVEHAPRRLRRTDHCQAYQRVMGLRRLPGRRYQTVPTDAALACG